MRQYGADRASQNDCPVRCVLRQRREVVSDKESDGPRKKFRKDGEIVPVKERRLTQFR